MSHSRIVVRPNSVSNNSVVEVHAVAGSFSPLKRWDFGPIAYRVWRAKRYLAKIERIEQAGVRVKGSG